MSDGKNLLQRTQTYSFFPKEDWLLAGDDCEELTKKSNDKL